MYTSPSKIRAITTPVTLPFRISEGTKSSLGIQNHQTSASKNAKNAGVQLPTFVHREVFDGPELVPMATMGRSNAMPCHHGWNQLKLEDIDHSIDIYLTLVIYDTFYIVIEWWDNRDVSLTLTGHERYDWYSEDINGCYLLTPCWGIALWIQTLPEKGLKSPSKLK